MQEGKNFQNTDIYVYLSDLRELKEERLISTDLFFLSVLLPHWKNEPTKRQRTGGLAIGE